MTSLREQQLITTDYHHHHIKAVTERPINLANDLVMDSNKIQMNSNFQRGSVVAGNRTKCSVSAAPTKQASSFI